MKTYFTSSFRSTRRSIKRFVYASKIKELEESEANLVRISSSLADAVHWARMHLFELEASSSCSIERDMVASQVKSSREELRLIAREIEVIRDELRLLRS